MEESRLERLLMGISKDGRERAIYFAASKGLLCKDKYGSVIKKIWKEMTRDIDYIAERGAIFDEIETATLGERYKGDIIFPLPENTISEHFIGLEIGEYAVGFDKAQADGVSAICERFGDYQNAGIIYLALKQPNKALEIYERGKRYGNATQLAVLLKNPRRAMKNAERAGHFMEAYIYANRASDFRKASIYFELANLLGQGFKKKKRAGKYDNALDNVKGSA